LITKIPKKVYDSLKENPDLSGRELHQRGLATSSRTGRRWKSYFRQGIAIPDENYFQPRVTSQQMEELEDDEDFDLEQFLEMAPQLVREAQRRDPVITHDVFDFASKKPVAVMFPSCAHLGGRYTAYEEFRTAFQQMLAIDRLYVGSMGDDIEGFEASFRDADAVYGQIVDIKIQYKILESVLEELASRNKLLFGVASQHGGDWTQRSTGSNPIKSLYLKHGVPFFDGMAYVTFKIGEQNYKVALSHAFKGTSAWNPLHPQMKAWKFEFPRADLVVMGDRHQYGWSEVPGYGWEEDAPETVLLLQCGTMKILNDKFTIKRFSQGRLGWPVVVFSPDDHVVKWSTDLDDIKYWLGD